MTPNRRGNTWTAGKGSQCPESPKRSAPRPGSHVCMADVPSTPPDCAPLGRLWWSVVDVYELDEHELVLLLQA